MGMVSGFCLGFRWFGIPVVAPMENHRENGKVSGPWDGYIRCSFINPINAPYNPINAPYNPINAPYNPINAPYNPINAPYNPSISAFKGLQQGGVKKTARGPPPNHHFPYDFMKENKSVLLTSGLPRFES